MQCQGFLEIAERWMEGERNATASAHLDGCPRCRGLMTDLDAVREGARVAAVGETNVVVIKTVVVQRAFGMALDPVAGVIVTIGTDEVVVSASYEYNPVTPLISAFLPSGRLNLQAETSMRLEFNK